MLLIILGEPRKFPLHNFDYYNLNKTGAEYFLLWISDPIHKWTEILQVFYIFTYLNHCTRSK